MAAIEPWHKYCQVCLEKSIMKTQHPLISRWVLFNKTHYQPFLAGEDCFGQVGVGLSIGYNRMKSGSKKESPMSFI